MRWLRRHACLRACVHACMCPYVAPRPPCLGPTVPSAPTGELPVLDDSGGPQCHVRNNPALGPSAPWVPARRAPSHGQPDFAARVRWERHRIPRTQGLPVSAYANSGTGKRARHEGGEQEEQTLLP